MLVYPENTIWAGREKQARRNYGRTHFSWLPVIENKLQIGWWHGISDINNVSSDWVTAPLICWEKATHTLPAQQEIKIERAGLGEKNMSQGDEKREGDVETEDSLFHFDLGNVWWIIKPCCWHLVISILICSKVEQDLPWSTSYVMTCTVSNLCFIVLFEK